MKPINNLDVIFKKNAKDPFNFNIKTIKINNKCISIRKSLRSHKKIVYNYNRKYNFKPKFIYYCNGCDVMSTRKYCVRCKKKLFNLEDFDKDGELNNDINIDISDSEKSTYNLKNFVVNDSEKNYYCPDCKEYRYSEFHTCVSRYEFIFNQNSYINDNNILFNDNYLSNQSFDRLDF